MPENCCLILDTVEGSERGRTGETLPIFSLGSCYSWGCCPAISQGIPANDEETSNKFFDNGHDHTYFYSLAPNISSFYVNGVEARIRWQRTIGIS